MNDAGSFSGVVTAGTVIAGTSIALVHASGIFSVICKFNFVVIWVCHNSVSSRLETLWASISSSGNVLLNQIQLITWRGLVCGLASNAWVELSKLIYTWVCVVTVCNASGWTG